LINIFEILAIMEMEEPTKFGNIGKKKGKREEHGKTREETYDLTKRGVFTLVLWRLCLVAPSAFSI
jgi:hypothetical protein